MMKAIRQLMQIQRALPQVVPAKIISTGFLLLMLLLLTGCGEDAFVCDSSDCSTSSTTTTTGGTTGGTGGTTTSGVTLTGSMSPTSLGSGESASVTFQLRNSDASAYTDPVTLNLTTSCGSSVIPTTANPVNGIATVSYTAGSCTGNDTITASTTIGTEPLTATVIATITAPTVNVLMGRGFGASFEQNLLATGTGAASDGQVALAAGGSTSVTATLVDDTFALFATATDISFSSPCVAAGNATITSPITTNGGQATTTYIATGCSGTDTITASATIGTTVLTAQQTITVAAATVGSVQFISANPSVIAIAGTGGGGLQETSTLTFKVVDNLGGGVSGQTVNFALNTNVGGIQLSAIAGVTQSDGTVQVTVQSGTIPTPVNVTATTTDLASGIDYSTQSDALVISTGRADQDSFSISIQTFNPEAFDIDGVDVPITIRAADHFNNPVPDGTSISFRTEGGSIDASCATADGACSVIWTSQDPRPTDGRVTILAYADGNESYTDANGNGLYDDFGPAGFFDFRGADLAEAWLDVDEDGVFDTGFEEFVDFNQDGTYTAADGRFTGVLCQHSTDCAATTSLHVREDVVLVMARSSHDITTTVTSANSVLVGPPDSVCIDPTSFTTIDITVTGSITTIGGVDYGGQYPPAGTSVSTSIDVGKTSGTAAWTVANGTPPIGTDWTQTLTLTGTGTPGLGILTITVQTPSGTPDEVQLNVIEVANKVTDGCT